MPMVNVSLKTRYNHVRISVNFAYHATYIIIVWSTSEMSDAIIPYKVFYFNP